MNFRNVFSSRSFFAGAIALVVTSVGFFYFSFVSAQPLNDQKRSQASQTDLPTAEFRAEPSYLVKKGGEVNLFTTFRGYAGEASEADQVLYNWCVDGRPINSLIAGSGDEFVENANGYTIQNEFGVLSGGQGSCAISSIYNQDGLVRWFDNLNGGQEAANTLFTQFLESNVNQEILEYGYDEYLRRATDVGDATINSFIQQSQASGNFGINEKRQLIQILSQQFGVSNQLEAYFSLKARFSYKAIRKDRQNSVMLTRTPAADDDIDGDGMSDAWEIKYFGKYAGKKGVPVKTPEAPRDDSFSGVIPKYVQGVLPDFVKGLLGLNTTPGTIDVAAVNPEPRDASGNIIENPTKEQVFGDFLRSIKPEHDFDGDGFFFGENYGNCAEDFYPNQPDTFVLKKMLAGEACWGRRDAAVNSPLAVGDIFFPNGSLQIIPGIITELWQTGVPYAKLVTGQIFDLDKGYFPNGFEYVAGTNPTQADTDSDGVPDGYDYAGLKQNAFPLKIQKDDDYEIDVHLFGRTQRGSIIRGQEARKGAPDNGEFNNTAYRHWRTDLENQKLKVGGGLELPTRLVYSPYPVTPSSVGCGGNLCADKVHVTAATATEQVNESSLFYTWYLDGIMLPADNSELATDSLAFLKGLQNQSALGPDRAKQNGATDVIYPSGYGRNVLSFGLNYGKLLWKAANQGQEDLLPCSARNVGLDVIDVDTNKTSHAEIDIKIGDDVQLFEKLVTNVDPSKDSLLQGFNLNDPSTSAQIKTDVLYPQLQDGISVTNENAIDQALQNQLFKPIDSTVVDPKIGYRRGDVVSVSATLNGAPDLDPSGNQRLSGKNNCPQGFYDKLLYKWYFDDLYLEEESGRGKSTVEVAATNIGSAYNEQVDDGSHYLKLEVVDPDTDEVFARSLKEIRVISPFIKIQADGVEKTAGVSSDGIVEFENVYKVQPGAQVKVTATPRYFRPLPDGSQGHGFTYQWLRDGEPIEGANGTLSGTNPSPVTLDFTVDNTSDAYDEISLSISSYGGVTDGSSQSIEEEATVSAIFAVNPPEVADADFNENEVGAGGFLLNFLPDRYQRTFNNVFIFGGFTIIAIIALVLYQRNQKSTEKK